MQEPSKQPQTTSYWIRLLLVCCCWLSTPLDFYQKLIQSEQTAFKFQAEKKKNEEMFRVCRYILHSLFGFFIPPKLRLASYILSSKEKQGVNYIIADYIT